MSLSPLLHPRARFRGQLTGRNLTYSLGSKQADIGTLTTKMASHADTIGNTVHLDDSSRQLTGQFIAISLRSPYVLQF